MINQKIKIHLKFGTLVFLEIAVLGFLFLFLLNSEIYRVGGYLNSSNVTVLTSLEVGSIYPEILNISINNGSSITLIPNSTKLITCEALLQDPNSDTNLQSVNAEFFDSSSSYGGTDDNNNHYTNNSCTLDLNFGAWRGVSDDEYLALANCTFEIWYYADAATWNCTFFVNNSLGFSETSSNNASVLELLALGLPDSIDYGVINSTYISDEQVINITNYGNVMINLSLFGYGRTPGDNLSMNCSQGSTKNISAMYEKYNLTASNPGDFLQNLTNFSLFYKNLTSGISGVVNKFNFNFRHNDTENEAINATYWRIYVPMGVAGTCSGNIVFGARRAAGV